MSGKCSNVSLALASKISKIFPTVLVMAHTTPVLRSLTPAAEVLHSLQVAHDDASQRAVVARALMQVAGATVPEHFVTDALAALRECRSTSEQLVVVDHTREMLMTRLAFQTAVKYLLWPESLFACVQRFVMDQWIRQTPCQSMCFVPPSQPVSEPICKLSDPIVLSCRRSHRRFSGRPPPFAFLECPTSRAASASSKVCWCGPYIEELSRVLACHLRSCTRPLEPDPRSPRRSVLSLRHQPCNYGAAFEGRDRIEARRTTVAAKYVDFDGKQDPATSFRFS